MQDKATKKKIKTAKKVDKLVIRIKMKKQQASQAKQATQAPQAKQDQNAPSE